jgi:hypothetical protein
MNEFAFQFAVLRYIHDPVTEEFLNVGVVIYSKEARYLKSLVSMRYSRLSDAFQEINGEHYRRVVGYIERQLAKMHNQFQQLELFDEPPAQIEMILHQVLPPDDASLVFGSYGGGLTTDLDAQLYRLYERLVEKYMEREDIPSRTDKEVWQIYRKELDRHNITIHLSPVTIRTPTYHYEFEYAWKNELWNPIEPVSFDLMHEGSILEKANRWIGRATMLEDSGEIDTLYMLLGAPRRGELQEAYEKATWNMRNKIPLQLKLIEESAAPEFSANLAKIINDH